MKKIAGGIAAVSLLLSGCATTVAPTPTLNIATPFVAADHEWSLAAGKNTIAGDAVLRTVGGDVKTCAGLPVYMLPVTGYTREYVSRRFGSENGGYAPSHSVLRGIYVLDTGLGKYRRDMVCNAQGGFSFANLADGSYYVIARVEWSALAGGGGYYYNQTQGGDIAMKITVAGGETKTVTLTA